MIDFDQINAERDDLDFKIRGETFRIQMMPMSIVGIWTEREEPIDASKADEFMQMLIDRVADAVDDGNGSTERWRELCASAKGPSYGELLDLANRVWAAQTTVPTRPVSPSPSGRGATDTSSKAE